MTFWWGFDRKVTWCNRVKCRTIAALYEDDQHCLKLLWDQYTCDICKKDGRKR